MLNINSPRPSTRFSLLALVCVCALLFSAVAFAQTTVATGSIVGTVTDATGAVLAGANVTITGPTGQTIKTSTSGAGTYASGNLIPGMYTVRIEAKGFKTAQLALDVKVDNTANGSAKLEVGQESTVVEVQASEIQVNTEQATVQGVLTASQIENLPVNGRNFLDLAQLEPGVQIQDGTNFDPTKVGYSSISFGGRFGRTARIEVDGVDVSDETVGTTTEDIPASSIQEFSLAQSNLDLSNELTSSGAVNVVTKSGTNAYHGEAFGLFRDHGVGSASLPHGTLPNGTRLPSPYFQRNQEGASFGGPALKDKLFFFGDGERTLQHLGAPVLESPPFVSYSGFFPAPFKDEELLGRLDYQLTKTARLFGRYSYFKNSTDATFFPSSFQVYNNKNITRNTVFGADFNTGSFNHTIRFSYLKFQNKIVDGTIGTSLPFANYPVSMNIGSFTVGPNLLAPQSTPQSDHQIKYDGSKAIGKHIVRFGVSFNHIQGGGFAAFFGTTPNVYGSPVTGIAAGCTGANPDNCLPGPDGTLASNPVNYPLLEAFISNGVGYSTEKPALGFPAGGLGPDNRLGLYVGDSWKIRPNLTLTPGLRYVRDTGRTDSDLPAIPELNTAFPGFGNRVNNPNKNFAPQLGIAWDPGKNGRTVVRAGAGLFYENVIYNNVLFDRPLRLRQGAFLYTPTPCVFGSPGPIDTPTGSIPVPAGTCLDATGNLPPIFESANEILSLENQLKAKFGFNPTVSNGIFVGNLLAGGAALNTGGLAMFAPNYRSPVSVQMNVGIQREIRHGLVVSADFLRNVTTHSLLDVDVNHVGSAKYFNATAAQQALAAAVAYCGASSITAAWSSPCPSGNYLDANGNNRPLAGTDLVAWGFGTPADVGGVACPLATGPDGNPLNRPCAFSGINPNYNAGYFLEPISRSVYNGLQMKLVQNMTNPMKGVKAANFQVSYALSRFVNPLAFPGDTPPSNAVGANDQDFVLTAADNDNPLRYMGPSLLDRTHQISIGGNLDVPLGFRLGIIAHFYSPLSSPVVVGSTGNAGDIFRTDFTGSGVISDPLPGTKNGAFGRQFGVSGLNAAISNYLTNVAGKPTPAGNAVIAANIGVQASDLVGLGLVAPGSPLVTTAPSDQLPFTWTKALDFKVAWPHKFGERFMIEPSVGFYNLFNFSNFNQPPGVMTGWIDQGASSINSTHKITQSGETGPESDAFRVGDGTGVFGLASPRVMEFGMKVNF
jgi:hypothetical protein